MSKSVSKHVGTRGIVATKQIQVIPGKEMVANAAGGYGFAITPKEQFMRFLVIGTEGGTYYATEQKYTVDNAKNAIKYIQSNGIEAVDLIVNISEGGRAPKNDAAIFALAMVCTYGNAAAKQAAYAAITKVCRISTHLFHFCQDIQNLRGWSRGLRRGVANFYTSRDVKDAAYQIVKYRQRDGWEHRDVLRLTHPKAAGSMQALFKYVAGKETSMKEVPQIVAAFEEAKTASTKEVINLINKHNLCWEMIPTEKLTNDDIWSALLYKNMGMTAMIRNLGRMTNLGVLQAGSDLNTKHVIAKLTDKEEIKKARIHPLNALIAARTYAQGHGFKGKLSWTPIARINDALEEAIMLAFDSIEPSGKHFMLGIDVSGSMGSPFGDSLITSCEVAAMMALATAKSERNYDIMGFANTFKDLGITAKDTFLSACKKAKDVNFGNTDCALPMIYAMKHKIKVDAFSIYSDGCTWAGDIHPSQALKQYRKTMGINAKFIVVNTMASGDTMTDPTDMGSLDVVGCDTATPNLISDFARE